MQFEPTELIYSGSGMGKINRMGFIIFQRVLEI
jgi:hypothetical protein